MPISIKKSFILSSFHPYYFLFLFLFHSSIFAVPVVLDGSFEGGVPNADWVATSTFTGIEGFPLCGDTNSCPSSGGHTGDWQVWIGGLAAGVTSSVEQDVTIPTDVSVIRFWLLRGICDDISDTLHVSLDNNDVGTVICDGVDADYVQYVFSIDGFNDGGVHTLNIGGTVGGTNGTHSNFFVDDVAIDDIIFQSGFE